MFLTYIEFVDPRSLMLQNCERFRRVRMRANSGHGVDEDINLDIYKSNLLNRVVWRTENRKKKAVFSPSHCLEILECIFFKDLLAWDYYLRKSVFFLTFINRKV